MTEESKPRHAIYNISFENQSIIYVMLCAFFFVGLPILVLWPKNEVFLFLHSLNSDIGDLAFPVITYFGDGWIMALIAVILLFKKFGYFIDFVFGVLVGTLFVQLGKRVLFADILRPLGEFGLEALHSIPGVQLHVARSFPSGHSSTVMFVMLFLAILIPNRLLKAILIIVAFLGGYSRIYLGQHFFTDVYFGFLISVISVLFVMAFRNRIGKKDWFDKKINLF